MFVRSIDSATLQRDNISPVEHRQYFCKDCVKWFHYFNKDKKYNDLDYYIKFIPDSKGRLCERCWFFKDKKINGIYGPYFTHDFFYMLMDHTFYSASNKCQCYWPEVSENAATISNLGFKLFSDLFNNTALKILVQEQNAQSEFLMTTPANCQKFSLQGFLITILSKSFFYSHYARLIDVIGEYSLLNFNEHDCIIIQQKLEDIKNEISEQYLKLYKSCLKKHSNKRISLELELILNKESYDLWLNLCKKNLTELTIGNANNNYMDMDGIFNAEKELFNNFIKVSSVPNDQFNFLQNPNFAEDILQINWLESEILLQKGSLLNNLFLYKDSIETLSKAIDLNPLNKEAYTERSLAYFETGQISLALKDYEKIKKLTPPIHLALNHLDIEFCLYTDENKIDFSKGLLVGTLHGLKVGGLEFIPGIYSSCKGILHGLWAYACSPIEVSKEVANSVYAIGEYISDNSALECLQCVVPELRELSIIWNKIDYRAKGEKIGFIIGKYGIDIFLPVGALKGINKLQKLKRANTLLTLEKCAVSPAKKTMILKESEKWTACRQKAFIENLKKNKILTKCPNVQYHVMQKKHAWEKVIELTGDINVDFQKVLALLEEHNISHISFLKDEPILFPKFTPKIKKSEYEKTISGFKVHVEFETYLETGESFLKDAWVITK